MLNQSVVGAPYVRILQTMYLANGSQNFPRKTGIFFGNSCKGLSKALSRAGSGRNKVIGDRLRSIFKIEVLFEAPSVLMRRWGMSGPPFGMMGYWWSVLPQQQISKI